MAQINREGTVSFGEAGRFTRDELKGWEPLNDIIPMKKAA